MESGESAKTMNPLNPPRACIDNQLGLIQKDLDDVEKRLVVILEELLGPRLVPGDQARGAEKTIIGGLLNQIVSKLSGFRVQLERIRKLEKDLENSVIGSPKKTLTEP